jgi:predicted nucleic acid-binding protein
MATKPLRVYADTSVYGGAFDDEFAEGSRAFLENVSHGALCLVTSPLVVEELQEAPERVRKLFGELRGRAEMVPLTADAVRLQGAYLSAGIVEGRYSGDALHVAVATTSGCALLVSWNFRHVVRFDKVAMYNGVNLEQGFRAIEICSPWEAASYGHQDEEEV